MPNESAGAPARGLPSDLSPDFERFREMLRSAAASADVAGPAVESLPDAVRSILSSSATLDSWREYGRLLHDKAADLSLIGKGDRSQVYTRHVLDSLNPLALFPEPPTSTLDLGSGGGLPGIPLAIAWPRTRVVLLESRERKAGFLEQTARALKLANVRVVCARLEDYGRSWTTDGVASVFVRALGDLGGTLELASPVAGPDARWVYFLGSRDRDDALAGTVSRTAEVVTGAFGGRLLTGHFGTRPGR